MAIGTPTITGPDGVARTVLAFTTTSGSRFLTGTAGSSTAVAVEVSINGAAYTDDPDFVVFDGVNWTVPNPVSYPRGLDLIPGVNTVAVRSVALSGLVSGAASATITYAPGLTLTAPAPTNVSVLRKDTSVVIYTEPTTSTVGTLVGVNVYAAAASGGGTTGYIRVNINTISTGNTVEELSSVGSSEHEYLVDTAPGGGAAADPLFAVVGATQQDQNGNVLSQDFADAYEVPETAVRLRTTVSVQAVRTFTQYAFDHNRSNRESSTPPTVFVSSFAVLDPSALLYYVTTAVYFDETTQTESESPYSVEVAGGPLRVTAQVGSFPVVSRQVLVRDTIASILRSNPQVRVDPGSVLRDTFIDPFANEAERLRFIIDFFHRAQSFAGILAVDDPNGLGVSVPVANSPYKTALRAAFRLNSDQDVQNIIDRAVEALASNFGIFRRDGKQSRGEVTFSTTRRPTESLIISVGSTVAAGSVIFSVVQAATISLAQIASYYDPTTRRYSVTVAVQAATGGSAGNVASGQVRRVVSGPSNLTVTNASAMFGGTDQETNTELATRARNALASVDSGTKQGYLQIAADVAGVLKAQVVSSGDTLMMRDLYDGTHIGGKVDVWVQGTATATVTDVFAFEYDTANNVHFEVVGLVGDLRFRAIDPNLSPETPISQMLYAPNIGYSFRNATTGEDFDLTGATIVRYDTVQLDTSIPQPTVTLTDVVLGDYRRARGNDYTFRRQPVTSVTSITGTISGGLSPDGFTLYHPDDPLMLGGSTLASDFVRITPINGVPSGGAVQITNEAHVLVGEFAEYLDSLGVDPLTIVVTNSTGTLTYATSGDPNGFYDYAIVDGDTTTATAIVRVPTGRIPDGTTVLVSYQHGENFSVTYVLDQVPGQVQTSIDARRNVTADVLAKAALPWSVDIIMTVVLAQGAQRSRVDSNIRSTVAALFDNQRLGNPVRQSDVIAAVESVSGVSYIIVPLTRMAVSAAVTILRDTIRSTEVGDVVYVSAWSTPTVSVWMLVDALTAIPVASGGIDGDFHSVSQDDINLVTVSSSPEINLSRSSGRAYVSGAEGLIIPGVSDDATLISLGYITTAEILTARASITGGRVFISTAVDDAPSSHLYTATYQVGTDNRVYDLDPGPAEYVRLNPEGGLTITYDEDR